MEKSKYILAGISIVAIWLAVLFVGLYGGSLNFESQRINHTITTDLPIAFLVAICAAAATIAIARRAFKEEHSTTS
jgi:hypothetical protein